jgi:GT2 family glycosyltransferase
VDVTIVVVTRNRRERLLATLERLTELPERARIIVVDNDSDDGSPDAVGERFPDVATMRLTGNRGAAARNAGVAAAGTELVGFCDDDSWFEPGALTRAAELFDARPWLGLMAARIIVEPGGRLDPTCALMARTPLDGGRVLGFVAAGAVVLRRAFMESGGFAADYGVGGEELLLALDLAAAGWDLVYADDVVAHHEPDRGPRPGRTRVVVRNDICSAWMRRPLATALRHTARAALAAREPEVRAGMVDALRSAPAVFRRRRVLPARVERDVRLLERGA